MKLGSIVARLFKRERPPLSPIIKEMIAQAAKDALARGAGAVTHTHAPHAVLPAGVQPPPDAECEGWSWDRWAHERSSAGERHGWAFCRFAVRTYPAVIGGPDRALFVFGLVRGCMAVWQRHHAVCRISDEGEHNEAAELLTSISHLPSGYGLGVFADLPLAMDAAELADRIHPWHRDPEPVPEGINRTLAAWDAAGIKPIAGAHAHSPEDHRIMLHLNGRTNVMDGKPERLS